jgi:tol-pal system protein YbgF
MRFVSFFVATTLLVLGAGCASTEHLTKRVSLLEKEVADLHRANRDMGKRLDEIQIQLSLLLKKIVVKADAQPKSSMVRGPMPRLKVVKLRPDATGADNRHRVKSRSVARGPRPVPVEPHEVTERLQVDTSAAKLPLMGGLTVEPGQDGVMEEDQGYDEESIRQELNQALLELKNRRHSEAIGALIRFSHQYPEHPLAADALYALGQARFAQGDYQDAQVDFSAVSRQHPESRLAAGSMLMAARCQEKLGRRKDARSVYLQLVQAYPLTEEAAEANRRLQSIQ